MDFMDKKMDINKDVESIPLNYNKYVKKKIIFILISFLFLITIFFYSISVGNANVPLNDVFRVLLGQNIENSSTIIWNIRLPRALAAISAGVGLSVSGVALQSILRNPLGSPYTLGISNAAAFGAAFSVIILGAGSMHSTGAGAVIINNPYITTIVAFLWSLVATFMLLAISKYKGASPEVMILIGVALSSLFTAGTMFLQYFADDVELAAVVFWTFGDVGRADWGELGIITAVVVPAMIYFIHNRWNYNAIDAGDETARGLGVNVERIRLWGMLLASFVTAIIISFLGVIGFIGLVCPHIARRFIGDEQRFLIPASCITGGLLLLASDTAARLMLSPHVLPVAILTSFMGAPLFIYLLVRGYRN
ncbi:iron ABC transporter permease [Methanohalobium sp.]|uniref:FecCD family ABC transporter permease n=1 Tax=Methanohalobium sp. TaxID=2837493 RepID=UPI0025EA9C87|nr:iron ABC transporter permease [Methanohalobium sp.]